MPKKTINKLKSLYRYEKCIPEEKEVTDEDIWANRDFFKDLLSKKNSYLTCEFIPKLIRLFKNHANNPRPDTHVDFSGENMELSPEGTKEWKDAIEEHKKFRTIQIFLNSFGHI